MEYFVAPNGEKIPLYEGRIITFGLTEKQNEVVRKNLSTAKYDLYSTDVATDIIAIPTDATIIQSSALNEEDLEMITEYYCEVIDCTAETIFWLGYPKPRSRLRAKFKCYENFEELTVKLKYLLLTAHKAEESKGF